MKHQATHVQKSNASNSSKLPKICSEWHFLGYILFHEICILHFIFFPPDPVHHSSRDFVVVSCGSCMLSIHFAVRSCGSRIFQVCSVVRSWGSWILNLCFPVSSWRSWILIFCFSLGLWESYFFVLSGVLGDLRSWLSDFAVGSCRS